MILINIIIVNIALIGCAFLINPENANYLLAGYNTMSEKEKKKFDIVCYIKFMRSFFIKVSVYSSLLYVVTYFLFDQDTSMIIWVLSLIIPWPIFIIKSQKFSK